MLSSRFVYIHFEIEKIWSVLNPRFAHLYHFPYNMITISCILLFSILLCMCLTYSTFLQFESNKDMFYIDWKWNGNIFFGICNLAMLLPSWLCLNIDSLVFNLSSMHADIFKTYNSLINIQKQRNFAAKGWRVISIISYVYFKISDIIHILWI